MYVTRSTQNAQRACLTPFEERGSDCPVIVIVRWNMTFQEEYDIEGMALTAGFKTVRSFPEDPDRGFMQEIKQANAIPFTTNPPAE
jgi:hypothetical protein